MIVVLHIMPTTDGVSLVFSLVAPENGPAKWQMA